MQQRPQPLKDVPKTNEVRDALKGLCTAPRGYTILNSPLLLGLAGAQKHMPEETNNPEEFSDAVRKYLNEMVDRVEKHPSQVIIEVVLGLGAEQWQDREWRERPAYVRRTKAGELFRGKDGQVKNGTIRGVYETPALEEFAKVISQDDKQHRG